MTNPHVPGPYSPPGHGHNSDGRLFTREEVGNIGAELYRDGPRPGFMSGAVFTVVGLACGAAFGAIANKFGGDLDPVHTAIAGIAVVPSVHALVEKLQNVFTSDRKVGVIVNDVISRHEQQQGQGR